MATRQGCTITWMDSTFAFLACGSLATRHNAVKSSRHCAISPNRKSKRPSRRITLPALRSDPYSCRWSFAPMLAKTQLKCEQLAGGLYLRMVVVYSHVAFHEWATEFGTAVLSM
jgi:hypothetical protein